MLFPDLFGRDELREDECMPAFDMSADESKYLRDHKEFWYVFFSLIYFIMPEFFCDHSSNFGEIHNWGFWKLDNLEKTLDTFPTFVFRSYVG